MASKPGKSPPTNGEMQTRSASGRPDKGRRQATSQKKEKPGENAGPISGDADRVRIPERLYGEVSIRMDTFSEADRTVDVIWAEGAQVKRYDWREGGYYIEELDMEPSSVRMGRFESGMSLLDAHMPFSMDDRLGTVVPGTARVEGGKGYCTVKISKKQRGEELYQDLVDGHSFPISVGYRIHAYEKTEGDGETLPTLLATDWEPMEISAVPIPADPGATSLRSQGSDETVEVAIARRNTGAVSARNGEERMPQGNVTGKKPNLENNPNARSSSSGEGDGGDAASSGDGEGDGESRNEDDGEDEGGQRSEQRPEGDRRQNQRVGSEEQSRSQGQGQQRRSTEPAPRSQDDIDAAVQRAVSAERKRTEDIQSIGRRAGVSDETIAQHVRDNTRVEDFRNIAFDAMVSRQEQSDVFPHSSQRGNGDSREDRRSAITNALMNRVDPANNDLTEHGRNYRGLNMLEMARECLRQDGERNAASLTKTEVATRAFHSTSDFPLILQNVIRNNLRAAYEEYPQTFGPLARRTTAPDFKEITSVQLSEGPRLLKVNEHGEYKRGTLSESGQKYSIATYGRIVGVTRQLLINDNLGAFTRIPQLYGRSIAQLESDIVWDLLISNIVMSQDNQPLFSAAHKNVASAAPLTAKNIGLARTLMGTQKGLDGKTHLNLRPRFLVVAPELEFVAEQLLGSVQHQPQVVGNVTPASIRSLQVVVEPRLSVLNTGLTWFLVADPAQIDTIEYAYLEGQEGAYMETKEGWDVDGMEIKCRLDFGATVMDDKAFVRNEGAALPE